MAEAGGEILCLVEDDPIMGESLCDRFELEGLTFHWHQDAQSAIAAIGREHYAAIVSDVRLPDLSGEEMYCQLLDRGVIPPPTLFITGFGHVDQAVRLLKYGAQDYITKPFDLDHLLDKLRAICPTLFVAGGVERRPVLGISPLMRRVEEILKRLGPHLTTVLITGESGVGKEHAARYLHEQAGNAADAPFIAVNCAAMQETLLEAELFGYEKGAFTGAVRQHRGVFERAHGGTLFLDEVGEMSVGMQAKLLRAIQDHIVQRVGGETPIQVEVRLVCATNCDLKAMVEEGRFREDLYYRINVAHVDIPPLRNRKEDVLWFAQKFVSNFSKASGEQRYLLAVAERFLVEQSWPGNIRELKHMVERACILAGHSALGPRELGDSMAQSDASELPQEELDLKRFIELCEARYITDALRDHDWRIMESAQVLGISRKSLWEKMRKHGIREPQ